MAFHSAQYGILLVVVLAAYWSVGRRPQNVILLVASYAFYGWVHPWFLALIIGSTLVDYLCVLGMAWAPRRRRALLGASLVANLGLLGFFKYFGFFVESVGLALESVGIPAPRTTLQIALPVGISFYTFQTMSYTIDVYRGVGRPCRNLLDYAVYVAFFPQLVAGPVERAQRFLTQVQRVRRFDPAQAQDGLVLLAWGFCLKLVVADNLAPVVDKIFMAESPGFAVLWIGVVAFGMQIYADFYGYTCIARGSAKLMGFELVHNFEHPYLAQTPTDFWRRWNMSITTWFRDYVYIPLGGNRTSELGRARNVLLTWAASGLWHGASWNFVFWGLYHGSLILVYRAIGGRAPLLLRSKWLGAPRTALMFVLTTFGWMLFRERDTGQILHYLRLDPFTTSAEQLSALSHFAGLVLVYSTPIVLHSLVHATGLERRLERGRLGAWVRPALVGLLVYAVLACAAPERVDFIYFRF